MAPQQQIRRRYSVADQVPADLIMPRTAVSSSPESMSPNTTDAPAASSPPGVVPTRDLSRSRQENQTESTTHSRQDSAASSTASMPPPPDSTPLRRGHSRSKSSMCRQNRLSLTLPIAPPTSDPSRPTPTSAVASVPPTPIESGMSTPSDANEFIIAIAAQERRVLELREELLRAETDLTKLKKLWSTQDITRRRGEQYPLEAPRPVAQATDDEPASAKRSIEMDRRKQLQQSQPSTPQSRRKVMRGGHKRTLSLLSPGKDESFNLFEDRTDQESVNLPPIERRAAQLTNPNLSKRASWAPRSQQTAAAVPQIVEDFKLGLRAFVEDIRQITVGDEPINGQNIRSTAIDVRNGAGPESQDTIRQSHALRPKVSTVFEPPHSAESTPIRNNKTATPTKETQEKTKATKGKHFSWTPLGLDSLDDNDWSNWESPSSSKTSRWSGSTMGSSSLDDTPDEEEPVVTPSRKKLMGIDNPLLSPKLEEISNMVNRLPSNIKRTATNLMDEWEKSLNEPQAQQRRASGQVKTQNKENSV
ncbi:hypothetical protein B0J13DRAFT_438136 [Dactylonectria estremocensis]|uniref:DUF4048 domain-containing protein n=1 Tax=Dactylonectria estremocensis TaxID=1079267 RepID=A0A9P9J7F3_9HYPO|nr:hypothetical protein B0J13DRAFT_438136 [Dactylonectria estremocensis]